MKLVLMDKLTFPDGRVWHRWRHVLEPFLQRKLCMPMRAEIADFILVEDAAVWDEAASMPDVRIEPAIEAAAAFLHRPEMATVVMFHLKEEPKPEPTPEQTEELEYFRAKLAEALDIPPEYMAPDSPYVDFVSEDTTEILPLVAHVDRVPPSEAGIDQFETPGVHVESVPTPIPGPVLLRGESGGVHLPYKEPYQRQLRVPDEDRFISVSRAGGDGCTCMDCERRKAAGEMKPGSPHPRPSLFPVPNDAPVPKRRVFYVDVGSIALESGDDDGSS